MWILNFDNFDPESGSMLLTAIPSESVVVGETQ